MSHSSTPKLELTTAASFESPASRTRTNESTPVHLRATQPNTPLSTFTSPVHGSAVPVLPNASGILGPSPARDVMGWARADPEEPAARSSAAPSTILHSIMQPPPELLKPAPKSSILEEAPGRYGSPQPAGSELNYAADLEDSVARSVGPSPHLPALSRFQSDGDTDGHGLNRSSDLERGVSEPEREHETSPYRRSIAVLGRNKLMRHGHSEADASETDSSKADEPLSIFTRHQTVYDHTISDGGLPMRRTADSGATQQRSTKISNKFQRAIRRNKNINRSLLKFKRVKRHQVKDDDDEVLSNTLKNDTLYDPVEETGIRREMFRLSAFCTCESFEISELIEYLEKAEDFDGTLTLYADVLHVRQKHWKRDVFILEYGCVVFFNLSPRQEEDFLALMHRFEKGALAKYESEDFDFCYGNEGSVRNDEITLSSYSSLEKLSVAFAVAQCTKLSVYEERIAKEIDSNTHISETLASTGSIGMSQNEISRKIGILFRERNNVNLHFDVLDSPEFLWSEDRFKHVYDRLFQYLELGKRVELLNKRLAIMKELFEMLSDQMERKHATKLEWIIIWLIVFEVVVLVIWNMLLKDILGFFHAGD